MKVYVLFDYEDLRGVYKTPELARVAATAVEDSPPVDWVTAGTVTLGKIDGSCRFTIYPETLQ